MNKILNGKESFKVGLSFYDNPHKLGSKKFIKWVDEWNEEKNNSYIPWRWTDEAH